MGEQRRVFEKVFDDVEYILTVSTVDTELLMVDVEERETAKRWHDEFSSQYIEDMTHKAGSFKRFSVFVKMLFSGLGKESDSVSVNLYTYKDLEEMKKKRLSSKDAGNVKPNNKRYLVITYSAEFDRVRYPLPLHFVDRPTPDLLQNTVDRLLKEVRDLRRADGGAVRSSRDPLLESDNRGDFTLASPKDVSARLFEENERLKAQLRYFEENGINPDAGYDAFTKATQEKRHLEDELEQLKKETFRQTKAMRTKIDDQRAELEAQSEELAHLRHRLKESSRSHPADSDAVAKKLARALEKVEEDVKVERLKRKKEFDKQAKLLKAAQEEIDQLRATEKRLRMRCKELTSEVSSIKRGSVAPSPSERRPRSRPSSADGRSSRGSSAERLRPSSRPGSAERQRPASRPSSRPTSARPSRPSSAERLRPTSSSRPSSRPSSAERLRPTSSSRPSSRPSSAERLRPTSSSRPSSRPSSAERLRPSSRPSSAERARRPTSADRKSSSTEKKRSTYRPASDRLAASSSAASGTSRHTTSKVTAGSVGRNRSGSISSSISAHAPHSGPKSRIGGHAGAVTSLSASGKSSVGSRHRSPTTTKRKPSPDTRKTRHAPVSPYAAPHSLSPQGGVGSPNNLNPRSLSPIDRAHAYGARPRSTKGRRTRGDPAYDSPGSDALDEAVRRATKRSLGSRGPSPSHGAGIELEEAEFVSAARYAAKGHGGAQGRTPAYGADHMHPHHGAYGGGQDRAAGREGEGEISDIDDRLHALQEFLRAARTKY